MKYLKLMRTKHYVKNLLVFVPLFFSKELFNIQLFVTVCFGFACFCCTSSAVYIFNDLIDIEKDQHHPKKKNRPLASGQVSKTQAIVLISGCLIASIVISFTCGNPKGFLLLAVYFLLNIAYSIKLKNYPIIDVVILASGFVIRIIYGSVLANIVISSWLYLVMVAGSLFMGLGKRRNELKQQKNTREVLKYYNEAFVDKNMYVTLSLVIVFYALWAIEFINSTMIWTVPLIMVILMKYSYNIEGDSDGDPVEVLLHDKILILLSAIYIITTFSILYIHF